MFTRTKEKASKIIQRGSNFHSATTDLEILQIIFATANEKEVFEGIDGVDSHCPENHQRLTETFQGNGHLHHHFHWRP